MIDFAIRRLRPGDSFDELTTLLHRAFAELASKGLDCQCASQTSEQTRQRALRGECFVAVNEGQVIGTMTLENSDRASSVGVYRDAATASVHQLAVDPSRQREGVGRSLIACASVWARARRYDRLALDTPEAARRQVAWYVDRGFDVVETVHLPGRRYASVVLAKAIAGSVGRVLNRAWPTSPALKTFEFS